MEAFTAGKMEDGEAWFLDSIKSDVGYNVRRRSWRRFGRVAPQDVASPSKNHCFLCITSLRRGSGHVTSRVRIQLVLGRLETTSVSATRPYEVTSAVPHYRPSRLKTHLQPCDRMIIASSQQQN